MFTKSEVGTKHDVYYLTPEVEAAAVFNYGYWIHYSLLSTLTASTNFALQPRAESLDLEWFSE